MRVFTHTIAEICRQAAQRPARATPQLNGTQLVPVAPQPLSVPAMDEPDLLTGTMHERHRIAPLMRYRRTTYVSYGYLLPSH
jgi:hypothetical protein